MIRALRSDPYAIALWLYVPFVALSVVDGLWKGALLRGPHVWFWAYDVLKWIILPAVLLKLLQRLTRFRARDYGLSADLGVTDIAYILPLPLFALFFLDLVVVQVSAGLLSYPEPIFDGTSALQRLGALWIVGTFYMAVTAGIWESVFFIGLPWLWLSRIRTPDVGRLRLFAVASAILFALAHLENGLPNAIGAFAFQLLAVWWYVRLETLWPVICSHILIDLLYFWPAPTPP